MEVTFSNEELGRLYEGEKVKNKVYQSNPQLVKQYVKTINLLRGATKIEQLTQFKSLRYHKLEGERLGQSSVSINMQYRLIFYEVVDEEPPHEVVLLEIEEISKHYE